MISLRPQRAQKVIVATNDTPPVQKMSGMRGGLGGMRGGMRYAGVKKDTKNKDIKDTKDTKVVNVSVRKDVADVCQEAREATAPQAREVKEVKEGKEAKEVKAATEVKEAKLQRNWMWWHDTNWEDRRALVSFDSVEQFWRIFNHDHAKLEHVTTLCHMTNLRLFQRDVSVEREHADHQQGGQVIVQFQQGANSKFVESLWLGAVLDAIGERHPCLLGLEFQARNRGHRLSFWVKTRNPAIEAHIGDMCSGKDAAFAVQKISFKSHKDILAAASTFLAATS